MDTLEYAASQLKKYSLAVFGRDITPFIKLKAKKEFDDSYTICILEGKGEINASNERSLLMGVYKIFHLLGCKFVRPGKRGEYIVKRTDSAFTMNYTFTPSYAHRGITIEGAVSKEHLLELIEWMPKVGLNSYFMQFRTGYEFFERWYHHKTNDLLPPEPFDQDIADEINREIAVELKKRDILYHKVGHGWTCEALGISSKGWFKQETCTDDVREKLAMVNGERSFYKNTPLNTHLCYSNPKVQKMIVAEVIRYAQQCPEVDYLHFWLADDANNVCECPNCRDVLLADYYIEICNEIDKRLSALNISTKIVFLVYLELYWIPKKQRFYQDNRFTLMFAPIFRSYSKSLLNGSDEESRLPYKLNKNVFPSDTATYVTFLKDWQALFKGDSFDFDYHLMWDICRDYSGLRLAEILHKDIVDLRRLGLNGLLSCQLQRAFFPTAFSMYVLSSTLCDNTLNFRTLKERFFAESYGANAKLIQEVFTFLQQNFDYVYLRSEKSINDDSALRGFLNAQKELPIWIEKVESIPLSQLEDFYADGIEFVIFWLKLLQKMTHCLILKAEGNTKQALLDYAHVKHFLSLNEERFGNYIDGYYFEFITKGFLESGGKVNHGGI